MLLYHYMKSEYLMGSILNNCLKLSTMNALNDPFEMLPALMRSDGSYAPVCYVREVMRDILKDTGIFCLSEIASSSAMWAHYADKHRGVALEFEFTDQEMTTLFKVDCSDDERVTIAHDDDLNDSSVRYRLHKRMIEKKARCWDYEREYRWVFPLSNNEDVLVDDSGLFWRHLPEQLRRMILGIDCELHPWAIRKALGRLGFADIAVAKARLSDSRFEIVVDRE